MADGKVVIETDLDSSGIEKGLSQVEGIAKKGLGAAAKAVAGVTAAVEGVSIAAVKVGSDFESQMSKVQAISGATGSDFEALTKKAKEMGAKTKFSATESGQAMEYMTMAGWKTEDMLSGIEGIMNLAAASGEDLASTSDIVTDALTAFGLSAKDSTHFADVLAQASSNANTNVGMMGETFKYVAPVAGALKFSAEDCATAIGLMANAGIKGSQAGTSLRAIMSRMAKPTEEVAGAMQELGVSLTDSKGNMKSLDAVMGELRGGFKRLGEAEKAQMAASIGGQEAMSGLLAIVNASDADFYKLKESIYNADGAAEKMAETMQDNLQGSITILKSGLEGLGIEFYESVKGPLRDTADETIDAVSRMSNAFKRGGLDEAVEEAGDIIADFSVKATEHAPDMVDTAVNFIEAFAKGIGKNKKKLVKSAEEMAETLVTGMAKLLPKKTEKTIVTTFNNVDKVIEKLAKTALPPLTRALEFAGENLDLLASFATAAFVSFKGYKVITETTSVLNQGAKAWKTASAAVDAYNVIQMACTAQGVVSNVTLTAGQAAVGLLTGRVSLATAAQTAWNAAMSANPIGLVITAVAALAAGIAVYKLTTKEAEEENYKLSDSQKEVLEACKEVTDSMAEERAGREETVQSIGREYGHYEALASELQRITDENGKVKEGYQERAKVIAGELSEALGMEIELTDGIIQNYQETIDKVKEVIVQKKAEALLSSMQGEMAKAYEKSEEAIQNYKEAAKVAAQEDKAVAKAAEEVKAAQDALSAAQKAGRHDTTALALEVEKSKKNFENATAAQKEAKKAVDDAKSSMSDYASEVNNYNALVEAMATGEAAKIESAITALVANYKSYSAEALAESEKVKNEMYSQANGYVDNLKLIQDGSVQVADSVYQDMAKAAVDSIAEFNKLPGGVAQGIKDIGPKASSAIVQALAQADIEGKLDEESRAGLESFISGFSGLDKQTQEVWSQAWFGALEGLEGFDELKDPAEDGVEAFLESLKAALKVHSPSRAVKAIFAQVWPGAGKGLEEGKQDTIEKGKTVVQEFLENLGKNEIVQKAKEVGANVLNFFGIGIESEKGNIEQKSKGIADSSNEQLGSADTKKTGNRKTKEYNEGVNSNKGKIDKTSKDIADSSDKKLGSADTKGTGARKTKEYDSGVGSNKGKIDSTSLSIAASSDSKLGSADTKGTGNRKSSEYNTGLGSNKGSVSATSKALSDTANAGMGSADTCRTGRLKSNDYDSGLASANTYSTGRRKSEEGNSGLGSVDARGTGSNFVQGFINGFGLADVWSAAWNIGKKAIDSLKKSIKEGSPSRITKISGKYFGQGFELGIKGEEKAVAKASDSLAETALSSMDMSDIASRMREVMALNTSRVTRSFTLQSDNIIQSRKEINGNMKLSEEDMRRLARQFGTVAGKTFANNMSDTEIVLNDREFGRAVRKVKG